MIQFLLFIALILNIEGNQEIDIITDIKNSFLHNREDYTQIDSVLRRFTIFMKNKSITADTKIKTMENLYKFYSSDRNFPGDHIIQLNIIGWGGIFHKNNTFEQNIKCIRFLHGSPLNPSFDVYKGRIESYCNRIFHSLSMENQQMTILALRYGSPFRNRLVKIYKRLHYIQTKTTIRHI